MEVRSIILLLAVAAVNVANGKPIFQVPVDPDVEPARESELMVSKCLSHKSFSAVTFLYEVVVIIHALKAITQSGKADHDIALHPLNSRVFPL